MKNKKEFNIATLAKPVKFYQHSDNYLGYEWLIMHALVLDNNGLEIGAIVESDMDVSTINGEDYYHFCENYSTDKNFKTIKVSCEK